MRKTEKLEIVKSDITKAKVSKEPRFRLTSYGEKIATADKYPELKTVVAQLEQLEEQVVVVSGLIKGYPLDVAVQVNRALAEVFGFAEAKERRSFFGDQPPQMIKVQVGLDKYEQIVFGELAPPSWERGSVTIYVDQSNPLVLRIHAKVKRKFEDSLNEVMEVARKNLRSKSIYSGNAIELDMKFIDQCARGEGFNPEDCAPIYKDVSKKKLLILPRDIESELEDIMEMIRHPEHLRDMGESTKHGLLLTGTYGTGKTLASYCMAQVCVENGWTFMGLKTPEHFRQAYEIAGFYGPNVLLFVEDCDEIFKGERSKTMNAILETLDGVGAKNDQTIVVFTSNNPDKINDAFMRSGRIDTHIELGKLDGEAAGRFIQAVAKDTLAEDVNLEKAGSAFKDLVPADITEGVKKAKRSALLKHGPVIAGTINTDMLILKGEIMQRKAKAGKKEAADTVALRKVQEAEKIKHADL